MDWKVLPEKVERLVELRDEIKNEFNAKIRSHKSEIDLSFTFDGNLVGDIGKALAAELFGVKIIKTEKGTGVNGLTKDGRTVQIKATATGRGPSFLKSEKKAEIFLFFKLDLDNEEKREVNKFTHGKRIAMVMFNGPSSYVSEFLPVAHEGLRAIPLAKIIDANAIVPPEERLPRIDIA